MQIRQFQAGHPLAPDVISLTSDGYTYTVRWYTGASDDVIGEETGLTQDEANETFEHWVGLLRESVK